MALSFLFTPLIAPIDYDYMDDETYLKEVYPNLKLARILETGESFGEIALLTDGLRHATIVCQEDT